MPQLDGLRFLAIAGVMIQHNWRPGPMPWIFGRLDYAETGVRLFFVLSGFLITGILLRGRAAATVAATSRLSTLRNFYVRRFLRIFPVYYATLLAVVLLDISPARQIWPWLVTYTTNIYIWHRVAWIGHLGHLWTLAVEEQFYIVWPWLVLFLPRRLLRPILGCLIVLAPLYRLYASFHYRADVAADFASGTVTIAVVDSLALGALLAVVAESSPLREQLAPRLTRLLLAPGLVLWLTVMALAFYGVDDHSFIALGQTAEALVCGWIVVGAARGFRGVGRALELRPIAYLGKISYGIYIFHYLVPVVLARLAQHLGGSYPDGGFRSFALSSAVTVALAAASWQFFESPLNRLKRFFPYRTTRVRSEGIDLAIADVGPAQP